MFLVDKVPLVMINSLMGIRFRCVLSTAFFTSEEPSTAFMLLLLLHFLSLLVSKVAQSTALQRRYAPNVKQSCIIQEFQTYQAGSCRWNCSCRVSVLHQCRLRCSGKVGSDRHQILHRRNPYMHLRTHKKMLPKTKRICTSQ